jgi:hypothetical protein
VCVNWIDGVLVKVTLPTKGDLYEALTDLGVEEVEDLEIAGPG